MYKITANDSEMNSAYSKRLEELIKGDMTTFVCVKVCHHLGHFCLGELQSEVVQTFHQFFAVKSFTSVVIHDTKRSGRQTRVVVLIFTFHKQSGDPKMPWHLITPRFDQGSVQ